MSQAKTAITNSSIIDTSEKTRLTNNTLLENILLVVGFLGLYGFIAYYLLFVLHLHNGDTLARTANGFFVAYSRQAPHLTAVGFVWQPLISLMQLPFFPLTRYIGEPAASGPLLSVIFGAFTLPILNQIGVTLNIRRIIRIPAVILYGLHPTIALYSSLGLSEVYFYFFQSIATLALITWALQRIEQSSLIIAGLAIAGAFWVRYEALPLIAGFSVSVLIITYIWTHHDPPLFKGSIEAVWISLLIPTAYSAAIWMFSNWLIVDDPLYFYRGVYQQIFYTDRLYSAANPLYHNVINSVIYVFRQVTLTSVLFPVTIIILIYLCISKRTFSPLIPFFGPFAILVFHIMQDYQGFSFGWYRFATYMIPAMVPIFFWIFTLIKNNKIFLRVMEIIFMLGLVASLYTTLNGMTTNTIAKEETPLLTAIATGAKSGVPEDISFISSKRMADYINENKIEGPILIDTFDGFVIVLYADNPKNFIITQDTDFQEIIVDPIGHDVKWLLVSDPALDETNIDLVRDAHPGLLEGKVPWAVKEKEIYKWQLFRVVPELADD